MQLPAEKGGGVRMRTPCFGDDCRRHCDRCCEIAVESLFTCRRTDAVVVASPRFVFARVV